MEREGTGIVNGAYSFSSWSRILNPGNAFSMADKASAWDIIAQPLALPMGTVEEIPPLHKRGCLGIRAAQHTGNNPHPTSQNHHRPWARQRTPFAAAVIVVRIVDAMPEDGIRAVHHVFGIRHLHSGRGLHQLLVAKVCSLADQRRQAHELVIRPEKLVTLGLPFPAILGRKGITQMYH